MRETQFFGLPKKATDFLSENLATPSPCPTCKQTIPDTDPILNNGDVVLGMFDEEIRLHTFRLKDGRILVEKHQETIWSSGPCIFTMLVDEGGKELYTWTKEEIEIHL